MGDYRKLWESLKMDLEKHDALCAVLPELYGSVYLSQKDRADAMNYFNFVISEVHGLRIEELNNHRQKGGKVVGTFCVYVPDEILNALGVIGVGLCGGSQFWIEDGEKVLPRNLCPLIKAFVGAKISATCPYFQSCDLLVGETTCDGKKKAYEILSEYTPTYVMELPQMKREKDIKDWEEEIKRFIKEIENLTGNKLTYENLKNSIKLVNRKRRALKRLYELRKNNPSPISGLDALLVSQIAFYDDIERFTENVENLCDELEKKLDNLKQNNKKRLLVTGTPMAIPNWKLHHIVENLDAQIVVEETCTGTRYFENEVSEDGQTLDDLIRNIAERYMKINCACFTPNEGRIEDIIRLAKEYKVDGVIYYNLSFCQPYSVEYKKVEKALNDENIPVILIETDYSTEDVGQIKTRIEAFLEMI